MISCMDSKGGCDSYYNGLGFTKEELIKAWNNRHPEVSTHDIARAMQGVDFDINELVMLKGKKYQVISMSAGMKLAEAIVKELNDPRT